ncbi:MAG: VWA domain-containing protein [Deltaproteobacteria bacterium]|nr:VWA domain-containing protein [Deltaproteobacteria bacterium]
MVEKVRPSKQTEAVDRLWQKVRRKHLFPEIPKPRVGQIHGNVAMEMKNKQITLSGDFLDRLGEKMETEEVLEALLDHGVGHHSYCPWDFKTHLTIYAEAKRVVGDKDLAKRAAGCFMDVVVDTNCVKRNETTLPRLYRNMERGLLEEVIFSLYEKIWGIDLGSRGDPKTVRRLSRIPYLDRGRWPESVHRFTRVIKQLLEEEQREQSQEKGKERENMMGGHDLSSFSPEEVDQGLRDFAKEARGLKEFREVVEDFEGELTDLGYGTEGGMGRGRGGLIDADILYYMKLAENYSIPIRKKCLEKRGYMHPHSHSPWEVGKPVQDIDVWTSFGKIMPGITQTWKKHWGKTFGDQESTPDCIILIDSSGSMINPRKNLSYAVLGAACATDAYLRNGARVGAYNFSDAPMGNRIVLDFASEREVIYRVLCKYFGGGTALNLKDLEPLMKGAQNPDIFLITDMKITNLGKIITYLSGIKNRVTAVYIGESNYAHRFTKAMADKGNVSIFNVTRKEDIPKIVLGKIREYFGGTI